jgi:hypothetical protein
MATYSRGNLEPRYVLSDCGDFLRLRWAPGITIDVEDVQSSIAAVKAASVSGKRPLLVHIDLVHQITPEAKQLLISETSTTRTAVVGVDEIGKVLSAFNYRAVTPSRYFDDEAEAISWLLHGTDPNGASWVDEQFTAEMRGDVLWILCKSSKEVDNAVAAAIAQQTHQLSTVIRPPVLIRLDHLISVTDEALHTLANKLHIAALAIVGAEPGDAVITAYYKQHHHPPYPTKHFTAISDAEEWLSTMSTRHNEAPTRVMGV